MGQMPNVQCRTRLAKLRLFDFFRSYFPLSTAIFLFLKKEQKGFTLQSGLGMCDKFMQIYTGDALKKS
jgi:hypothetical protein